MENGKHKHELSLNHPLTGKPDCMDLVTIVMPEKKSCLGEEAIDFSCVDT
jgi:hypothetical protein